MQMWQALDEIREDIIRKIYSIKPGYKGSTKWRHHDSDKAGTLSSVAKSRAFEVSLDFENPGDDAEVFVGSTAVSQLVGFSVKVLYRDTPKNKIAAFSDADVLQHLFLNPGDLPAAAAFYLVDANKMVIENLENSNYFIATIPLTVRVETTG